MLLTARHPACAAGIGVTGLMQEATVLCLRRGGEASSADLARRAYQYALRRGARVINNSWRIPGPLTASGDQNGVHTRGSSETEGFVRTFAPVLRRLQAAGVINVWAAGKQWFATPISCRFWTVSKKRKRWFKLVRRLLCSLKLYAVHPIHQLRRCVCRQLRQQYRWPLTEHAQQCPDRRARIRRCCEFAGKRADSVSCIVSCQPQARSQPGWSSLRAGRFGDTRPA